MNSLRSVLLLATLLSPGCRAVNAHAPTLDVLGSYFPAWILCMIIGLVITLVVRLLMIGWGLHAHLRPKALVYPCLAIFFTLVVWLIYFQN